MARILMVVRSSEGGAFEHVARLGGELARRGHDIAICGPHTVHRERLDVELIPVEIVRPVSPVADVRSVRELAAATRSFRPDLVHTHGSKGGVIARAARLAAPRTPLVHSPHGYAFAGYFQSRAERLAYKAFERAVAPLATRVLCVCHAEARLAASVGPRRRIRVVHNGIDAPAAPPEPHPVVAQLCERGPVVGTVSGLRPGKGVETLVDAFADVARAHPDAALVVAGDGRERTALEERIAAAGISDRVHLLGELPEVEPVIVGLDVFAFASWAESFPYAILEAMCLGRPIVATDVGGISEAMEDGISGLLVPARDPTALSGGISSLLGDGARASALGSGAALRHGQRFTLSRMVDDTLAVYGELVEL